MKSWPAVRPSVVLILVCACAASSGSSSEGAVIVQQVESDANNADPGVLYAPVDFAGASSKTVSGVTYFAMSSTASSTFSGHAATVASQAVSYAAGAVSTIYNQEANGYLSGKGNVFAPGGTNNYGLVALPAATLNNIKVVNHSWIYGPPDVAENYRYIRTIEYLTARDDLVMASGAVTNSNASLMWSQRNGISVRGTQSFNPSATIGGAIRKHADLWGPVTEEASFTTPQVAGISAQMIQRATDAGMANATRHEVVKSILMTGANKTATDTYFISWTRDLSNNMDVQDGAGRADANKSYSIVDAGQKSFTALSSLNQGTTIVAPAVSTSDRGWGYLSSISELQSTAMLFHQAQPITDLTATLSWDVTPALVVSGQGANQTTYIDAGADLFANLDLQLYSVDFTGGVYTLGSALSLTGLSSSSTDANLEHLYYTGTLPSGYYAFVASYRDTANLSGYNTDAGFSYDFTAVPEPSVLLTMAAVSLAALARRSARRGDRSA